MNLKTALDGVSFIIVVALGVYQIYISVKRFKKHVEGRKEFLAINKETLNEAFLEHTFWVAAYGIVSAVSFALGAYFFVKTTDYIYASACIALGLIMLGFVLDSFVTRRSWYYEDGFFFEAKFYRYRSLAHIEPRKGIFPAYDVRFHAQPDMIVSRKMGEKLKDKQAEWKKNRKEKKK